MHCDSLYELYIASCLRIMNRSKTEFATTSLRSSNNPCLVRHSNLIVLYTPYVRKIRIKQNNRYSYNCNTCCCNKKLIFNTNI